MSPIRFLPLAALAATLFSLVAVPSSAQVDPNDMVSGQVRSNCNTGTTSADLYTVPSDKRLVLTDFTCTLNMNATFTTATTIVTHLMENTTTRWTVTLTQPTGSSGGNSPLTVDFTTGLVVGASNTLSVSYFLTGQASTQVTISWSGYLVPLTLSAVEPKSNPGPGLALLVRPNPARAATVLHFQLDRAERVLLAVYDVKGRRVRTLIHSTLPAGQQDFSWDGKRDDGAIASEGIYFARLETPKDHRSAKILREL